jgi:hypothetical protein
MSSLVALTLSLSPPLYFNAVKLHTRVIRVIPFGKVGLFVGEHLDATMLVVFTRSLIRPINENLGLVLSTKFLRPEIFSEKGQKILNLVLFSKRSENII